MTKTPGQKPLHSGLEFDKFQIVEAAYWALTDCHGGQASPEYERLCRLGDLFRPGPTSSSSKLDGETRLRYECYCESLGCEIST